MAARRKAAGGGGSEGVITLTRLAEAEVEIPIVGVSPLIPHRWSQKARLMMPGHPEKEQVREKKGVRKPEQEAESCLYRLKDGRAGMPATAFKAAIVGACRLFDTATIPMVTAKVLVFVVGEQPKEKDDPQLVPIKGKLELHEDTPRNSGGTSDLRYRYYLVNWSAVLKIKFLPTLITEESIATLVDAAGRIGVGDWRPGSPKSSTGIFGTWRVDLEEPAKKAG